MNINKNIVKKRKNMFIIFLTFVFFVSFFFISNTLASGYTLTRGGEASLLGYGSSSHVSGDYAGYNFILSSCLH